MTKLIKFFTASALAAGMVLTAGAPAVHAAALSTTQIQAVISLLQAFGADATSISNVEAALGGVETSGTTSNTALSASILGLLKLGDEGDSVKLLQVLLAADPSVYPEGTVSGFFGPLTLKALRMYQKKHGLEQTGAVGPRTLRHLEEDLDDNDLEVEDGDNASSTLKIGRGRLCAKVPPGHLIAPGWLRKHGGIVPLVPECQKLPPGIAKKLGLGGGTGTTTPDTTAPVISSISVNDIASTSASVRWTTNESSKSRVYFDTENPLVLADAMTESNSSLVKTHTVSLTSLTASTTYFYVVESKDAAGNTATSSQNSFTTGS